MGGRSWGHSRDTTLRARSVGMHTTQFCILLQQRRANAAITAGTVCEGSERPTWHMREGVDERYPGSDTTREPE